MRQVGIPAFAGDDQIACRKRPAHSLSGGCSRVGGVVEPPSAIVIVKMVVWIVRPDADGSVLIFSYDHDVRLFGWLNALAWAQKKIEPYGTI